MKGAKIKIAKRIADPVHGTIGLTTLETRIIDTRVFQRLRNVKHLGLAHLVFPAADFSRFAHSLGVCHVTGRLIDALRDADAEIDERAEQKYRLAGLLHDIGHYPLSHALEEPIIAHLKDRSAVDNLIEPTEGEEQSTVEQSLGNPNLDHETVGRILLEEDRELREVLQSEGIEPTDVSDVFTRAKTEVPGIDYGRVDPLVNLISSDMDADRIDFLLRTSRSTGLPYGSVDLDYILSQVVIDKAGRVCLHERALRTVDHLLLARFFDTQQVARHKTVAVLEELAKDVVGQLLKAGILDIQESWIRAAIRDNRWEQIDDAWLMGEIRKALTRDDSRVDELLRVKIEALLERRPPKLVASEESFRETTRQKDEQNYNRLVAEYTRECERAADQFQIDRGLFYLWTKPAFQLSKIGSAIPTDELDAAGQRQEEKWVQSVRILPRGSQDGSSRAIMMIPSSLMNILGNYALDSVRLYVLEPPDRRGVAREVQTWLQKQLT